MIWARVPGSRRPPREYRLPFEPEPAGRAIPGADVDPRPGAIESVDRGAILIPAGRYVIGDIVEIRKSGVVLRGAGPTATRLLGVTTSMRAGRLLLVAPRADKHEYHVEQAGNQLFIRTNDQGSNFRLVTAPIKTPGREHWKELRAMNPAVMIEEVTAFEDVRALEVREGGLPHLEVMAHSGQKTTRIALPDPVYEVSFEQNPEFDTKQLRYAYQSLAVPRSVYAYDLAKHTSTLLKEDPVPGGFDRNNYITERVFATAKDGTPVPVSVVPKKHVPKDRPGPLHRQGYGGGSAAARRVRRGP